jgi:hypothetical protein
MRTKTCSACRVEKPIDQFPFNPATGKYAHRCVDHGPVRLPSLRSPRAYIRNKLSTTRRNSTERRPVCITTDYVLGILDAQKGRCALTGIEMTHGQDSPETNISIDRIDPSKGYVEGNIRLVCVAVNFMKHRMDDARLAWWCQQILSGMSS